jgi:hypothetical protein
MSRHAPMHIAIVSDRSYTDDTRIVEAALKSIRENQRIDLTITTHKDIELSVLPAEVDFIIWLRDAPLPNSLSKFLYLKPDQYNALIVQESLLHWRITKHLTHDLALQENLTVQLAALLLASESVEQEVQRNDVRTIPDSFAWRQHSQQESKANLGIWQEADSYLLYILFLLIAIERVVAYQRKQ